MPFNGVVQNFPRGGELASAPFSDILPCSGRNCPDQQGEFLKRSGKYGSADQFGVENGTSGFHVRS
ncbi:MAG TPA: hypothetical protein DIT89_13205 [Planctomycetaceae bacterium]|nr:hypothetical protein [Planctomycetaceae bacterium]